MKTPGDTENVQQSGEEPEKDRASALPEEQSPAKHEAAGEAVAPHPADEAAGISPVHQPAEAREGTLQTSVKALESDHPLAQDPVPVVDVPASAADQGSAPANSAGRPPQTDTVESKAPAPPRDGQAPTDGERPKSPAAEKTQPENRAQPFRAGAQPGLAPADEDEQPTSDGQAAKPAVDSANPAAEPEPVKAGEQRPTDPRDPDDVMTRRLPGSEAADAAVLAQSRKQTRRAFLGALAGVAAGVGVYEYLNHAPELGMQPSPLREAFNFNAYLNRKIFDYRPLAPTYPLSRAENLRINGVFGLKKELVLDTWRLQVVGVRDASRSPRYVADVTAWNYRYHGETSGLGANHDTKEAPKPPAAQGGGAAPGTAQPPAQQGGGAQSKVSTHDMMPAGTIDKAKSDENDSQDSEDVKARHDKPMPSFASSTKMAPKSMLNQAMADEMPKDDDDDSDQGEDDNHLGRKPRGREESGESNSTLRAGTPGLLLQLDDIVKLPRHEFVSQFKCIEGWSVITGWAGVRMADFLEAYPPELINGKEPEYVYMETPDGDYYTGYRLRDLRHPQALLVTEMMGKPLEQLHGAPLRLHLTNKYGYKQIKRIGLIAYTNDKPDDYWTKLGYDWYADL